MRTPLVAAFLLVALPAADAQEVTFARQKSEKGHTQKRTRKLQMDMRIEVWVNGERKRTLKQTSIRSESWREMILEMNAGSPSSVKVDYGPMGEVDKRSDSTEKKKVDSVSGKSYLLVRTGTKLRYTRVDGSGMTPAETKELEKRFKTIEPKDPLAEALAGRKIKVEAPIEVPNAAIAEWFGINEKGMKLDKFSFRLKEIREVQGIQTGIFAAELVASLSQPGVMAMTMTLKGDITIEVKTSRTLSIRLKGPADIKSLSKQFDLKGDAEMSIDYGYEYGP